MSENELVNRLAAALATQLRPAIPLAVDLWDTAMIAQYLKRDPDVVRERICCLPDFPKAIRLPSQTGKGRAHPLWKAAEVIAWTEKHQERRTGK